MNTILVLALSLNIPMVPAVDSSWEMIEEIEAIKVYQKDMAGSDVVAFMGEAVVDAELSKVLFVLSDAEHEGDWVDSLGKNLVLEQSTPFDRIQYQNFELPWPVSDRDFVYAASVRWDPQNSHVILRMNSVEHGKAPKTSSVRADIMESTFLLWPLADNKTHVRVSIFSDPKGWIPTWLVNLMQRSWPQETLQGIRRQVKKAFIRPGPVPPKRVD